MDPTKSLSGNCPLSCGSFDDSVRWSCSPRARAFLAVLVLAASMAAAQESAPSPKPSPASEKGDFPMDIPVPEGEPVKGIKIPYYAEDGTTLQMILEADVASRINENTIAIQELRIDANSDDGRKLFVEMPEAEFDLETRILTGTDGVTIRREDFEIQGQKGEFDIRRRFGKLLGNVKMVIYNLEDN